LPTLGWGNKKRLKEGTSQKKLLYEPQIGGKREMTPPPSLTKKGHGKTGQKKCVIVGHSREGKGVPKLREASLHASWRGKKSRKKRETEYMSRHPVRKRARRSSRAFSPLKGERQMHDLILVGGEKGGSRLLTSRKILWKGFHPPSPLNLDPKMARRR